jgi:nucleotide-binding universal stress UspA family protein
MRGSSKQLYTASEDFAAVHRKAKLRALLAHVTGERVQLLSFDEISQKLKFQGSSDQGVQDIPLDSVVGSVGRYLDFTREFLPLRSTDQERWSRVQVAMLSQEGVPPIDVYKLGDVYFVKDGNHRVSVARQFGATHIQANVVEIRTSVPITPDTSPDDLILRSEYADFMEKTNLDVHRPGTNLTVTVPGSFQDIQQQIDLHYYDLILEYGLETPYHQAVTGWFDEVYLPTVEIIREQEVLNAFPNRTETDLFLCITGHRDELEKSLAMEARPEGVATDLVRQFGPRWTRIKTFLSERTPLHKFEEGPKPGQWRLQSSGDGPDGHLFRQVLVPLNGQEIAWSALDQAAIVAARDQGRINGLHVITGKDKNPQPVADLQEQFSERCLQAGIDGHLVVPFGNIFRQISTRMGFADMLVLNLNHPPALRGLARLRSGLRDLIRLSPCPILISPNRVTALSKALVAYDGSPRSDEALFLAAMLSHRWQIPLVILHVEDGRVEPEPPLERARGLLSERGIDAQFVSANGLKVQNIVLTCEEYNCDFIIAGGYGRKSIEEMLLGSNLDRLLLYSRLPVMIVH